MENLNKILIIALKLAFGIVVAVIMLDAIYHSLYVNIEESRLLEQQPVYLKMLPNWIRWIVHDIGKFL